MGVVQKAALGGEQAVGQRIRCGGSADQGLGPGPVLLQVARDLFPSEESIEGHAQEGEGRRGWRGGGGVRVRLQKGGRGLRQHMLALTAIGPIESIRVAATLLDLASCNTSCGRVAACRGSASQEV